MAVTVSPFDEEALARPGGGSDVAAGPTPSPAFVPDAEGFLRFIRLTGVAEVRDGEVAFPPGILWPYTADLRRVRAAFDAGDAIPTGSLLAAIAALHERIAFAPGRAGSDVASVYDDVKRALKAVGLDTSPTRRCSRCRREFGRLHVTGSGPREQSWLCSRCRDTLAHNGARTES